MTKPKPTRLGKYLLFEVIGEGAMGTVYRAQDPVLHRDVAVKLMRKSVANDPHLRDRFEREARAAAALQHPNVVTIHDFGEEKGHLFIVMEFVTGTDLAKIIRDGIPLSLDTRLNIIQGVLEGLGYAHGHGIVHRDVKPANIRVLDDGRVKIMDFGIAHLTGSEITNSGVVLGTPDYMAPEQVEGRPVTPATDIFAVGAILYELLTHQKPFQGDTVHAVLHKVVTVEPAPLQGGDADAPVPEELQTLVRGALAKDTKARYASAELMIAALTAARRVLGERDTQATMLLRPAPRGRRRRSLWMAATAVFLAAVGVAAVTLGSPRRSESARESPPAVLPETTAVQASSLLVVSRSVSESAFAPLRQGALAVRGRASQAGATPTVLAVGDSLAREAEGLAAVGRQAEAVERLAAATVQWQTAGEHARKAKPAQPLDVRKVAEGTATRMAQAVAARDVDAIRRLYPNLGSEEQDRLVDFFQKNESIAATLRLDSLEVLDRRANAILRGTYTFVPLSQAKSKTEAVEYRATFERTRTGWRLTMIRNGFFKK